MRLVVDTGPLIALSKTGHLDLLPQLFDDVVVPAEVIAALRRLSTFSAENWRHPAVNSWARRPHGVDSHRTRWCQYHPGDCAACSGGYPPLQRRSR
jgi:hypothetical protein